jgi:hypothetical protein
MSYYYEEIMRRSGMTPQEKFDRATLGVLEQGEISIGLDGQCFYRLKRENGRVLKCAVGHIIPDDVYIPQMETYSVGRLLSERWVPKECKKFLREDASLLTDLQFAHDSVVGVDKGSAMVVLAHNFIDVAKKHGLDYSRLEAYL